MAALQPALSTALTVGNLGLSSYALEVSQTSAEAARCGRGTDHLLGACLTLAAGQPGTAEGGR